MGFYSTKSGSRVEKLRYLLNEHNPSLRLALCSRTFSSFEMVSTGIRADLGEPGCPCVGEERRACVRH